MRIAYLVASATTVEIGELAAAVRDRLREQLSEYMVQGETELAVAAIWRELFKLGRVGRHDDFFELGGHSPLASRMVARVRASFGAQVSLADVFDNPTVAGVAALIVAA